MDYEHYILQVILVVQPSGRLVNSLDQIDGGLQMMDSRFCGPLSALDRVTLSVLILQQFQPSGGRHQADKCRNHILSGQTSKAEESESLKTGL